MNSKVIIIVVSCLVVCCQAVMGQVLVGEKTLPTADDNYITTFQPFEFAFQSNDGLGTTQHRREAGDSAGTVKGVYGYIDPRGLYRTVEYVADTNGYRAIIKTNEPGTANQNSADAVFIVQPAPAGLTDELNPKEPSIPDSAPSGNKPVVSIVNPRAAQSTIFSIPVPVPSAMLRYPVYQRPTSIYSNPIRVLSGPLQAIARRRVDQFTPRDGAVY